MPTEQPDAGAWAEWETHLVGSIVALADGESLTLTGPEGSQRPVRHRKARMRGFIPARHELVSPWVRLERVEDLLRGHCVGAESSGRAFPLSPDEEDALLALGWHLPSPVEGDDYVRFWPDDVPRGPFVPRDEAERAAAMVAATFRDVLATGATDLPTIA